MCHTDINHIHLYRTTPIKCTTSQQVTNQNAGCEFQTLSNEVYEITKSSGWDSIRVLFDGKHVEFGVRKEETLVLVDFVC